MSSSCVLFSLKVKHSPSWVTHWHSTMVHAQRDGGGEFQQTNLQKFRCLEGGPWGGKLKIDGCTTLVALSTVLETVLYHNRITSLVHL